MFDKIGNLPLHPLVIHAVVAGIPLAALLAFLSHFLGPGNGRAGPWRSLLSELPQ